MSEKVIQAEIQLELAKVGVRLWRNNVGLFDTKDGRKIRTGLCVGSSDLVGFAIPSGRFVAVECKTEKGRATPQQLAFIDAVNKGGGIAFIARSAAEALNIMKERL
jgi:hypothetical protein